jgi:hypothetical protein
MEKGRERLGLSLWKVKFEVIEEKFQCQLLTGESPDSDGRSLRLFVFAEAWLF